MTRAIKAKQKTAWHMTCAGFRFSFKDGGSPSMFAVP